MSDLTFEDVDALLSYDPESGVLTWKVAKARRIKVGDPAASVINSSGYQHIKLGYKSYKYHRLAWLLAYKTWPDGYIDHKNGIRSDNRLVNLRACSRSENGQNRAIGSNNKSGVLGVSWYAPQSKWRARIMLNKKAIHIGDFDTLEEAAQARAAAKARYHTFQPVEREG